MALQKGNKKVPAFLRVLPPPEPAGLFPRPLVRKTCWLGPSFLDAIPTAAFDYFSHPHLPAQNPTMIFCEAHWLLEYSRTFGKLNLDTISQAWKLRLRELQSYSQGDSLGQFPHCLSLSFPVYGG